uniref:Uncharacterized protein n=1 Tax=Peronospora matthiolae TaxID=2874970 RepID=A0AAV1V9T0_9STRA
MALNAAVTSLMDEVGHHGVGVSCLRPRTMNIMPAHGIPELLLEYERRCCRCLFVSEPTCCICDYVYNKNKRYTPLLRAKNSSVYSSLCFVNK